MTPNLPQKLWRPLAEVKSYIHKQPEGAPLSDVKNKVGAFKTLKGKEQAELLQFLQARESILMLECRPLTAKRNTLFLRHKRYGYPKAIPGYEYPLAKPEPKKPAEPIEIKPPEKTMTLNTKTSPAALRKQAEELLKAAEEAEKLASGSDLFNKKLAPVKLEVLQAVGAVQRKFDEIMDCVGTLEKAAQKLKDLTA